MNNAERLKAFQVQLLQQRRRFPFEVKNPLPPPTSPNETPYVSPKSKCRSDSVTINGNVVTQKLAENIIDRVPVRLSNGTSFTTTTFI